jgi:preprotein translocase subunit SecE
VAVIAGGITAFYYFNNQWPGWVRVLTFVGSLIAGLGIGIFSTPGKQFLSFLNESMIELRRVVWPTREETVRTTIVVVIAVFVVGIMLFVFDWLLALFIQTVMG